MSSGTVKADLPSIGALKAALAVTAGDSVRNERKWLRNFNQRSVGSQEQYARLKGLEDHYRHKGNWSYFLMALMTGMIGFQTWLLIEVGRGNWDFTAYSWLLPALLAQNLAQIVGLAVFVVRSLFSEPKIIVANNQPTGGSGD